MFNQASAPGGFSYGANLIEDNPTQNTAGVLSGTYR